MITGIKELLDDSEVKMYSFSGMKSVKAIIEELDENTVSEKIFLELMACNGGCVNGPEVIRKSPLINKLKIEQNAQQHEAGSSIEPICSASDLELSESYSMLNPVIKCVYPEEEIVEIMQGKASVLLQKMPYGVVMVDDRFHVVDCNKKFAEAAGATFNAIFDSEKGIQGTDIRPYISFKKFFDAIFLGESELIEYDLREGEKYYHITIVSILQYRLACAIVRDMSEPEVQHELMTGRIHEVIKQNLEAVQRIAYLLGENSSFTESMLNSILESHDQKSSLVIDNDLNTH